MSDTFATSDIAQAMASVHDGMRAFARDHGAERPETLTVDELKALQMWVWSRQWWEDATPEARRVFLLTAADNLTPGPFYIATRDGIYFGRDLR